MYVCDLYLPIKCIKIDQELLWEGTAVRHMHRRQFSCLSLISLGKQAKNKGLVIWCYVGNPDWQCQGNVRALHNY